MDRKLRRALEDQGWRVERTKRGHWRCYAPDGEHLVHLADTPSDRRSINNALSKASGVRIPVAAEEVGSTMDWTVKIEAGGDLTADQVDPDDIDALRAALADHHAATYTAIRRYGAQLDVEAATAEEAVEAAATAFRMAAQRSGLPGWPVVRVDVMTVEDQEAALGEPTFPEILGVTEAAQLLGVSRQRVDQLRADHPDFPAPIVRLASGPVWLRSAIQGFERRWQRRPGRPSKNGEPAGTDARTGQRPAAATREG